MAEADASKLTERNNKLLVEVLLPKLEDQERFHDVVQQYIKGASVSSLVSRLNDLCTSEEHLRLFELARPYLRHEQQVEFNMLAPFIQSRIRVIRLRRKGNTPLGFSIRGGYEHGTGVFISEVQPNSEAHRQGLRVGDQILRINGFNIDQAIHEDVLNLLKTKPGVVLKVKSVGMIPVKDAPSQSGVKYQSQVSLISLAGSEVAEEQEGEYSSWEPQMPDEGEDNNACGQQEMETDWVELKSKKKDPLTWKVVDGGGGGHSPADSIVDGTNSYSGSSNYEEFPEVQVTLNIIGASGIGLTIVKGPPETPGIFVQTVKPNSLAECAGLQVGDQIIDMNGTSFLEIDFNQAVSLMKGTRELRLCLRKGAGLDLFPDEKSRRAAAMLNGASHTTKDERRQLPILNEEEERHTNGSSGLANGVIIAEIIQHPPPPSVQVESEGHQRQASCATTATLSERDVSISETNVPFTLDPVTTASTSSVISENSSSPPSTLSLESIENGHSDLEKVSPEPAIIPEKRLSDMEEESSRALKREEERLAEERRRLEAEQARLKEEAERLAQERKELEEEKRHRQEVSNIPAPPPTPPLNFLHELQNRQLIPMTPPTGADRARLRPLSMDSTKYQEEIVKRKQHEQLMQEFQKMHKKMFGRDDKPTTTTTAATTTIEEKQAEEPKNELAAFNFNRRQQVSVAPKPPPSTSTTPCVSAIVSRAASQPNLRQDEDTTDNKNSTDGKSNGESGKTGNEPWSCSEGSSFSLRRRGSLYIPPLSTNPHMFVDPSTLKSQQAISALGSETKRTAVVPSKPVLPLAVTTVTSTTCSTSTTSSSNNNPQPSTKESFTLVTTVPPDVNGNGLVSSQQATQPFPSLAPGSPSQPHKTNKDFPITDSRGPVPKPPQTYFEPKPQKGPLVTIGVYPDNSRQNRFSNLSSGEGVRNRQNQFESRSSSPSSTAPISVSMTSSSASSSATSSPHPPERKVVNGVQQSQGQNSTPPVSFKVTYNSKTNASVNSITVNKSTSSQGSPNSLTFSLNGKQASATAAKSNTPSNNNTAPKATAPAVKDPRDLLSPEDIAGREVKVLTIPKTGPLNMKVSGGSGDPESGGRIIVSELWEGGCIGSKVDVRKGDQIMMVGDKSLVNIKLTLANVILRDAMSSSKDPLKLVIAREKL